MDAVDDFLNKTKSKKSHAEREKARYWRIRTAVIEYLGGKCGCGETDIGKLEVHHTTPHLRGGYKTFSGAEILREWKRIIAGEVPAKLCCKDCHLKTEHNGNTCELKRLKSEMK